MTESNRQQYILQALVDHKGEADPETVRLPLRNSKVLPVIEVPLGLPLLNADSFRIAPQLEEHPDRALVRASPESDEAQRIVAQLVRNAHRKAADLKENLLEEGGQTQPGVITRAGKLINANTRCVLLRELQREGKGPAGTLRVAVLPAGITDQELLELEMVLQQQVELKDKYQLVGELMMIQRLFNEGFTDEQIARVLRTKGKDVRESREILALMHRARQLLRDPLPLTAFEVATSDRDRRQNWSELLRDVKAIDNRESHRAGDLHIKRWLIAYFTKASSVHKLRLAVDDWVERDGLVDMLEDHQDLNFIVSDPEGVGSKDDPIRVPPPTTGGTQPLAPPQRDGSDDDLGLDLLGEEPEDPEPVATGQVDAILDFVLAANKAGDEIIDLPNGAAMTGTEALDTVGRGVVAALDSVRRRRQAGGRLNRPIAELERARNALKTALESLDEVGDDPGFTAQWKRVAMTASQVEEVLDQLQAKLAQHSPNARVGGAG
ncbi:hypothetical protein ACQPYA_29730 [Micromonospora sp. CA-263727]|uniref:hypothetical protein n=1 Tax=Micromonospora sp. CA-263727 TaxID=3239967 RepID=UPI003D8DCC1D